MLSLRYLFGISSVSLHYFTVNIPTNMQTLAPPHPQGSRMCPSDHARRYDCYGTVTAVFLTLRAHPCTSAHDRQVLESGTLETKKQ